MTTSGDTRQLTVCDVGYPIICCYIKTMVIEFDPIKRDKTLTERGLDYVRAGEIFAELQFTKEDAREDYAEPRFISAGKLDGRIVILVWTPRGEVSRIISLMKANGREITCYAVRLA